MKQLKRIGMSSTGLLTFYKANLEPEKDKTEFRMPAKDCDQDHFY